MIADAQRIEHYEISAYGTAREYARALGRDRDMERLSESFAEEAKADSALTRIAVTKVNRLAKLQTV
jgi:ferritin-like metal-binding protein YciE